MMSNKEDLFPIEKVDSSKTYYCFTLSVDEKGNFLTQFDSRFGGWVDAEKGIEYREPAEAIPQNWHKIWESFQTPYLVVNNKKDFFKWYLTGGNALITQEMANEYLSISMSKMASVQTGKAGFKSVKNIPDSVFTHAPKAKKRMEILKRDKRKCQYCGESPDNNVHIVLNVHHIKPFGKGGLTHSDNLITLCHTCHNGLDPHYEWDLYNVLENQNGVNDERTKYLESIKRYQEALREELGKLNEKRPPTRE